MSLHLSKSIHEYLMHCFWAWLSRFLNCSPGMDNAHLGTPGKTHSKPKPAPCFPSTQLLQNSGIERKGINPGAVTQHQDSANKSF